MSQNTNQDEKYVNNKYIVFLNRVKNNQENFSLFFVYVFMFICFCWVFFKLLLKKRFPDFILSIKLKIS